MDKNFDEWNELKKKINKKETVPFCHPREIWWCSLGINVGSEEDGKNHQFERPVLIIKVFNKHILRVIPLSSKLKNDKYHVMISYNGRHGTVKLSQLKTISSQRLSRKLCVLDEDGFKKVVKALKSSLI